MYCNFTGTDFAVGRGRGDVFEDVGWVQHSPVWSSAQEEMAACATSGFAFVVVAGVRVHLELHVGSMKGEPRVRVGGAVVQ